MAVLPADARRFRAAPPQLAAVLADAGAELVDDAPDAEIVPLRDIRGDADVAVVNIEVRLDDGHYPRIVRAAKRVVLSLLTRMKAARARRVLATRGYRNIAVIWWDLTHTLTLPGAPPAPARTFVERFPRRALVVGRRDPSRPNVLEAVLSHAGDVSGKRLRPDSVYVRAGFVMAVCEDAVLRAAIGAPSPQITGEARVLESLHRLPLPREVGERVPSLLAADRCGLSHWSLVQRLPGRSPWPKPLSQDVVNECVEFLVQLHEVPGSARGERPLTVAAETLAQACRPRLAPFSRMLAARLDERLSELPRGFGHGDFFSGNLLVDRGHLVGVIDWDAGGAGHLPLIDLLHLRLHLELPPRDTQWGPAVIRRLVPWAQGGGDPIAGDYLERVGVTADPETLEALVVAYWLQRAAYQLRTHAVRRHQPRWIARNVDFVLEKLATDFPMS